MHHTLYKTYHTIFSKIRIFDGLPALLMRLIVAPVMIIAGYNKLNIANDDIGFPNNLLADQNVISWFGNEQWGLGLPFPDVLAFLAGWSEFLGGWLLLIGLLTRLVSIPLLFTMFVAATSVHWDNGWFSVAPSNPQTSAAQVFNWLGFSAAQESLNNSEQVAERLDKIKSLVETHGYPDYLYEKGNIVILNNGIEFSAIYFVMLLSLLFTSGGRFVSFDYWLKQHFENKFEN
ncbi:HvfX family Cu-binding RiPP maturation protein [Pseudoalteromonas sp. S16_S37]|uniref:HvfX family Cu-binding RiPP maturation protein n=1 Tax=Pseudoalteromonas sp. S16_S37 TaxID=2720228 RepID=UPI001680E59D|nr:DoxX family protein [Pseudoalteromonas sp. S16_S37]MBD1581355.1 DoxX family protein [Pseudoalteromonas sp. S16_S37]